VYPGPDPVADYHRRVSSSKEVRGAIDVRRAVPRDAEAIRAIYNAEVLTSTATLDVMPRTEEQHERWMAAHSGAYPALVAVDGTEIVGFACLSPYRPRHGYSTAAENSVYVAEHLRGRGVGRLLLESIIEAARTHGFHSVVARISTEQEASLGLHRACGFELVGVEREIGRKFGRFVDVAIAQLLL
jgi:L-amino acid N-acyltransferase YncA